MGLHLKLATSCETQRTKPLYRRAIIQSHALRPEKSSIKKLKAKGAKTVPVQKYTQATQYTKKIALIIAMGNGS